MYFKALAEKMGVLPDYVIEYFSKIKPEVMAKAKPDPRKILGQRTSVLAFKDCEQSVKDEIDFVQQYIMSQQWPILQHRVGYERSLCFSANQTDVNVLPNRYINRIGENIILMLDGSLKISSVEFHDPVVIQAGEIWRYNSRVPAEFSYGENFYSLNISYVDFDLTHYLMPFDVHGLMPRRRDEYYDYDPADESHKLDNVSTNEY